MNKDYFFQLWVISLLAYIPMLSFGGEHADSEWHVLAFRAFCGLNALLFVTAIPMLVLKWRYMLNSHRFFSIIGLLINAGMLAMIVCSASN